MSDPFLRAIDRAWVATGPYGAPNYDEFADCDAVRAAIANRPDSIVAVDNPQCLPDGLAGAVAGLQAMKDAGRYAPAPDALLLYEFGSVRAVVGLVGTDEISSGIDEPGRLWRNEEVFAEKVAERLKHVKALEHLISPVLIVPTRATEVAAALAQQDWDAEPLVTETDERGVTHRLRLVTDPTALQRVLDAQTFVVADGNHRSLAAQQAGFGVCLAVVADPAGLRIEPYHRLLRLDLSGAELIARAAVLNPTPVDHLDPSPDPSRDPTRNHLYADGRLLRLDLPLPAGAGPVDRLPHTIVERLLIEGELGLDPATVTYVGGAGTEAALMAEVDAGRATGALLLRPVTTAEFVAVNAARLPMPRKSTWFTPKARSGLVLAQL